MKVTALAASDRAEHLAELLRDRSDGKINITRCSVTELSLFAAELIAQYDVVIFICPIAEAVRTLTAIDYSDNSHTKIIQTDEYAKYVVPMAPADDWTVTDLAKQIAGELGAVPVLSEPEQLETFAIDKWAHSVGLRIANPEAVRLVQEKLISGAEVHYDSVFPISGALPPGITEARDWQESDFSVSYLSVSDAQTLLLVPPVLSLGIDASELPTEEALNRAFDGFLARCGCHPLALGAVCCPESGLLAGPVSTLCQERGLPYREFSATQIKEAETHFAQNRYPCSPAAACEKCAVLGMGGTLLVRRFEINGFGFAIAVLEPADF